MGFTLGLPHAPAFTAGDKNKCDYWCGSERLRVLAAAPTYLRLGALVSTAVEAALGLDRILAVFVGAAELGAQPHAPVNPRTNGYGEDRTQS